MAAKKKVKSKTLWFNGILGVLTTLIATLPPILEALATPEAAEALRHLIPESIYGILMAITTIGNMYLRTITTQPLGKPE